MRFRKINNNAISEVVSTLLTVAIVLGVVASVLYWGLPYLEEKEIRGEFQGVYGGFDIMYDTMSGLIIDGYGSKGFSNIISTNDESSLTIDSEGKKLILSNTFPGPPSEDFDRYDFNISGLDDEDDTFIIEMQNNGWLDEVQIYWIDPGTTTPRFTYQAPSYKKIYQNHGCAQSFYVPVTDWHLGKIRLYLMKRGTISSDLNVSIYKEKTSEKVPDVNNTLGKVVVPASSISSSYQWIECNFGGEGVDLDNTDDTYYIGLNTSEGSSSEGNYNYYQWFLNEDSPYNNQTLWGANTTDDDVAWQKMQNLNFDFRLNFTNNTPPNVPHFGEIRPVELYSGKEIILKINCSDSDDDYVKYNVSWGDGYNSGWSHLVPNGTYVDFRHTYEKPGIYTLTYFAKDSYDTIYEIHNQTDIEIATGDFLPPDRYYEQTISAGSGGAGPTFPYTITTSPSTPLNGSLRIDLFRSAGTWSKIPFGRIYVFDLGSITYKSPHDIGTQTTVFENGGILSIGPIKNSMLNYPSFFEEDDSIGFRIIQIGESAVNGVSGAGIYELGITMVNSYSREPRFYPIYNFKLFMNDSEEAIKDLWLKFFTTSYDFDYLPGKDNTIYYLSDGKNFVLDNSFIEINVEGLR